MDELVPIEEIKPIIIISGPIGAGKTTVAGELVKMLPPPVVYIEGDKFWSFIAKPGEKYTSIINFKMIIRSVTVAAIPAARIGYQVVLDFSIPPWYMGVVMEILGRREIPVDYIILKPSEETCTERAANREEGKIADYSIYKRLYDSFGEANKYTIVDEVSDACTIADHIMEGLDEGAFRVTSWEEET
jgi:hypothetical protein